MKIHLKTNCNWSREPQEYRTIDWVRYKRIKLDFHIHVTRLLIENWNVCMSRRKVREKGTRRKGKRGGVYSDDNPLMRMTDDNNTTTSPTETSLRLSRRISRVDHKGPHVRFVTTVELMLKSATYLNRRECKRFLKVNTILQAYVCRENNRKRKG